MDKTINETIKEILNDPYNYAKNVKITKLVNILKIFSKYYYNTGKTLVSDEIYDILRDILKERDPNNIYLKNIGAAVSKEKVKLPYFMPSLDKIKADTNSLNKFISKYNGPYVISDKLDGVSALYIYHTKQELCKLYTRGDGSHGQDISYLIPYLINNNINMPKISIKEGIAVRGELIISKNNFKKINHQFKNGRNAVAGLVNSKHYSISLAKLTDFIGYSILNLNIDHYSQMEKLKKWNFPSVEFQVKKKLTNEFLSDYLVKRRTIGKYEIDGIVVVDSSKPYKVQNKNPDHAFAFKKILKDQQAEVIVLDVLWRISKDGYLKPRLRIEPVTIQGAKIEYVTAFNAKYVIDNKLGPGSVIKLIRSGDVIPHILKVLKPAANNKPKLPSISYKWTETNVDIYVKDIHGTASDNIQIGKLTYFFNKMDVKYLSKGIITKLVNNEYNTIFKILKANKKDLYEISGLGQKIIDKIFINIKNSFQNVNLETIMAASNKFGRNFGERRIKAILDVYPNILDTTLSKDKLIEKIKKINGFDDITATAFVNGLPKFNKFYTKLKTLVDIKLKQSKINKKKLFANEKIVFTGFRDKNLQEFIINNGGKISSGVSKNTTLVIYKKGTTDNSKYIKAKELNIKMINKEDFLQKYK